MNKNIQRVFLLVVRDICLIILIIESTEELRHQGADVSDNHTWTTTDGGRLEKNIGELEILFYFLC